MPRGLSHLLVAKELRATHPWEHPTAAKPLLFSRRLPESTFNVERGLCLFSDVFGRGATGLSSICCGCSSSFRSRQPRSPTSIPSKFFRSLTLRKLRCGRCSEAMWILFS